MSLIRSGIVVGIFTLTSRIFGFVRDILISSFLGASILTDTFNIAFRLPNFFRRIFAEGAFSAAFVPLFSAKLADEGATGAHEFANKVFTILCISLAIFIIILELILPLFMYILAPGFIVSPDKGEFDLAIEFSRITLPYLFFISISSLLGGILNSVGRFAAFAAMPILLNFTMILAMLYLGEFTNSQAHALVWGVFLSGVVQLLFMVYSAIRAKWMVKFVKPKIDSDIKRLFKNMLPAMLGGGVIQLNILIDQIIASFLAVGSISLLAFADRINQLPLSLIGTAIGTVLLPALSKKMRSGVTKEAIDMQNRALEMALFLSIPCAIALVILAHPISHALFERGLFNSENTSGTAFALIGFVLGLPAYVMIKVLTPGFFAVQDTKTPVKISAVCLVSNIIFSIILIQFFDHVGIALSTSISAWVNALSLLYMLKKRQIFYPDIRLINRMKKIIAASMTMAVTLLLNKAWLYKNLYHHSSMIKSVSLLILILMGGATFLAAAYFLKAFDIKELRSALKK